MEHVVVSAAAFLPARYFTYMASLASPALGLELLSEQVGVLDFDGQSMPGGRMSENNSGLTHVSLAKLWAYWVVAPRHSRW
jgi:hypothetical protein